LNKTGSENKKETPIHLSDDESGNDISRDFRRKIYNKELELRKQLTKRLNAPMPSYNTSIGALPGTILAKNTFTNPTITASSVADSVITINGGPNGSMKVDVPLIVNGRDIMKELDEMRDALLLLRRDVDMESKYPRLKEIKDEYERELEKYKTFEALK
jgi:hypothetical protein